MTWTRLTLAALLLFALAGCRANQRTDLESYGRRDAVACLEARGGSASWAASRCDERKFAYDDHRYQRGWHAVTACASQKDGDAAAAAQACENATAS